MSDPAKSLRQRIKTIMPDLEIQQFERNLEGLINDVVVVNKSFVFRFARTEEGAELLDREKRILDLVRHRVGIDVPAPAYMGHDYMVYPVLPGASLSRVALSKLGEPAKAAIAAQLGAFLYGLHTAPISQPDWEVPPSPAPVTRNRWLDIRQGVIDKVYPLLLEHQVQWAENLFETALEAPGFFEYQPVLIHGDLAPYHILFDEQASRVTGVIDFGVAGMGDSALDIGNLITVYGERFVSKMQLSYPGLNEQLPRARFYAQSIELQWVLHGIETGETFWFAAHLGGARDIRA
jgi:aminoglycoside 2''-phosphotransferase